MCMLINVEYLPRTTHYFLSLSLAQWEISTCSDFAMVSRFLHGLNIRSSQKICKVLIYGFCEWVPALIPIRSFKRFKLIGRELTLKWSGIILCFKNCGWNLCVPRDNHCQLEKSVWGLRLCEFSAYLECTIRIPAAFKHIWSSEILGHGLKERLQ